MNVDVFTTQISRLASAFGQNAFSPERVKRISTHLRDLPDAAIVQIIDSFIDQNKFAPTPGEVAEAVRAWKRTNPESYGVNDAPWVIRCTDCYHTGWLHVSSIDHGNTMLYCHCFFGIELTLFNSKNRVPTWDPKVFPRMGFSKLRFPVEKFHPKDEEQEYTDFLNRKSTEKIKWWKEEQKKTIQFWNKLGAEK